MAYPEIDKDSPIPLYYQISQHVQKQIELGELKPGDYLPTERELQERFGVSRATIRRSISDLVYAGLLERRRSRGTIVSRTKVEATLSGFGSFTNEVLRRGQTPKSRILDFRITPAGSSIASHLQISTGESLVTLDRLREVDGRLVAVETWCAPRKLLPDIQRSDFHEEGKWQSTYYMLEQRFGIRLYKAEDTIEAVALEPRDAKLLNMEKGSPVVLRTRVSYTIGDVPLVYSRGVYAIKILLTLESKKPPYGASS